MKKMKSNERKLQKQLPEENSKESPQADPKEWLEQHGDKLFSFALARVKDRTLAEDLVQETLLSAVAARDSFEGRSQVSTWLTSILKNKIIDYFRSKARRPESTSVEDINELPLAGIGASGIWNVYVPNWGRSPEKKLEDQQFLAVVMNCISKLPERTASAFRLKFLEGLEAEDVCKALEISSSNFWVLLHRGRMALRECVGKSV